MEKEIKIKIEGEQWQKALDEAFKKMNKNAKIAGFRPGKAPKEVFIKNYGIESLFNEAAQNAIDDAYTQMLKENADLQIVAQPELVLEGVDEKQVEFKFVLTLKPEIKLGKYKGLKVAKEEITVSDDEVKQAIEQMQNRYIDYKVKTGKVENNDMTIIDFEGFKDGVAFEGGKGEDYSLKIGSQTFIPGFEEQLIGMENDEEKEIKVTFPEDYHAEDLKGQEVTFKVKVKEIKETVVPELDKDFFEDLGMEGISTKEDLEKQLRENITAKKEVDVENKYIDQLLEEASKNVKVDVPKAMIEEELHRMVHQYEENLKMQGISLEMFYQFTNSNEETLKEQMKEEATKRITYRLMLEEIAKEEKVVVSEEELNIELVNLANRYQMEKDAFLEAFGGMDMIKYDLEMRKAIEVLKS